MSEIDGQSLLKMGIKYQKWLENTSVNLAAYRMNHKSFYLAIYSSKFNNSHVKGKAILSPQSISKKEALQTILPHLSFSITSNNILESTYERAKLDYTVWENIRDYIHDVLQNYQMDQMNLQIYERAYNGLSKSLSLQNEMKKQWETFDTLNSDIEQRGYFTDADVEVFLDILIQSHIIQFKQFKQEYDHTGYFDVIYENRNKYRSYGKIFDLGLLKAMTSPIAKPQLEKSLNLLSQNEDVSHLSYSTLYDKWLNGYKAQLEVRAEETISQLRYP